jgi:hypothetical protein
MIVYPRESEITDLKIAICVHKNITGLEIAMDDTGRMDVFQPTLEIGLATEVAYKAITAVCTDQDLVYEVLNELLLKGSRNKQPL